MENPDTLGVLVSGRALTDYKKCGDTPGPDDVIITCSGCGTEITVTIEGAERIIEAMNAGRKPAGGVCTKCLIIVLSQRPPDAVGLTKAGVTGDDEAEAVGKLARIMALIQGKAAN